MGVKGKEKELKIERYMFDYLILNTNIELNYGVLMSRQ
jgi:hypothetical protein